ncbi:MAG: hypothetical protein RLZZ293_1173 [Pseudomonadota bacterium]|jgi:N-acetyl-gamma-glutamyl-phosphate reductase
MLIRASIIGASGYTGIELIRLLNNHPQVEISCLISETYANQEVATIYPHLQQIISHDFSSLDCQQIAAASDVVFLALPHTKASPLAEQLLTKACKVIDLSADLRLNQAQVYQHWYQHTPAPQTLLDQAIYGLAEIGLAKQIAQASLVANPGCYPTASILALAPALYNDVVNLTQALVIDAKSGVSGAGRGLNLTTHFCEASNTFSAYQIAGLHRHIPEIEQELTKLAKQPVVVQFTPHLIPISRGLMATVYCPLKDKLSLAEITALYTDFYQEQSFIRIDQNPRPNLKSVIGSNYCNLSLHLDERTNNLVIVSMIDNLLKGASGQAVQNMNLIYQLDPLVGLTNAPIYP